MGIVRILQGRGHLNALLFVGLRSISITAATLTDHYVFLVFVEHVKGPCLLGLHRVVRAQVAILFGCEGMYPLRYPAMVVKGGAFKMFHKTVDYSYLKRYQPSSAYKKLNQDKKLLAHWPLARDLPQARGAGIIMSGDKNI